MASVPTAWCSVALALLVALHEGEPPWPRLPLQPQVCLSASLPGLLCPQANWGHAGGSSGGVLCRCRGAAGMGQLLALPTGLLGLPQAGRELLSSESANFLNCARGGAWRVPLSQTVLAP